MAAGVGGWKVGGEELCNYWRWGWGSGASAVVCCTARAETGDWIWKGWDRSSAVSLPASLVSVAAASPPASLAGEWLHC